MLLSTLLSLSLLISPMAHGQDPLAVETQIFLSNPEALGSGGMANTLLAMSVAAIGSVMLTTCVTSTGVPLPPSLQTFSTAAAAYVLSEVTAANEHKADVKIRESALRTLSDRLRERGGGDVQRETLNESLKEQQFLQSFIVMRRNWLSAAIVGYYAAVSEAQTEASDGSADYNIICTGTLEAAIPVVATLGVAYAVDGGPSESIESHLGGVLPIVANQILPLSQQPDGRGIVATIAATTSSLVYGELGNVYTALQGNIASTQSVISEFTEGNGVEVDSGLKIPEKPAEGTTTGTTSGDAGIAATRTTTGGGNASVSTSPGSGSSAVNLQTKTCAEKSANGKSLDIKSDCQRPVTFPMVVLKRNLPTVKAAADATTKLSNALAAGDTATAKLAAANLSSMAAKILAEKTTLTKESNLVKLRKGKLMKDLDAETRKAIVKLTTEIKTEVTKRGDANLLASTMPLISVKSKISSTLIATPEEVSKDLPYRLRGKMIPLQETTSEQEAVADPVPKKSIPKDVSQNTQITLWQQLTDRYQNHYDTFFKKKP